MAVVLEADVNPKVDKSQNIKYLGKCC